MPTPTPALPRVYEPRRSWPRGAGDALCGARRVQAPAGGYEPLEVLPGSSWLAPALAIRAWVCGANAACRVRRIGARPSGALPLGQSRLRPPESSVRCEGLARVLGWRAWAGSRRRLPAPQVFKIDQTMALRIGQFQCAGAASRSMLHALLITPVAPALPEGCMATIAHCQKRARELTALAELDEPEHKAQHLADAAAWTRLAKRMLEMALRAA